MRLQLRKSSVFIGVLGFILLVVAPAVLGGSFLYQYTFTGTWQVSSQYLPAKTPEPTTRSYGSGTRINSVADLITRPYEIPIKYSAHINTETQYPTDTCPYIKFYQCYANGVRDGFMILNLYDEGQSVSNEIYLLPPNRGIDINVHTGAFNMWFNNFGSFTCWYQIEYQLDQAAPEAPEMPQVQGADGDGFYVSDSKIYTCFRKINLEWNTPKDNTTSFSVNNVVYNVGGVVKDYMINNGLTPMTQWVGGNQTEVSLLNEGSYTFNVVARDYDDNISSSSPAKTVITDFTPPSGSLAIKKTDGTAVYTNSQTNISYTNSTSVMLSVTNIIDSGSGISRIRFSNDNTNYSAWETCGSSSFTKDNWPLPGGDGVKTVYVQIKDKVGNITTLSKSITLDTVAPTGTIRIEKGSNTTVFSKNGVRYISGTAVTLTLSASDAGSGLSNLMKLSTNTIFETYAPSKPDTLLTGDGQKTISVTYFDNAGNSYTCSDSIILDQTTPTGTITINNGANYTGNTSVALNLTANDGPGVGVAKMRIWDSKTDTGWIAYQTSKSWVLDGAGADGPRTVFVQYQDEFNNYDNNKIFQAAIILDKTPPQGSFQVTSPNPTNCAKIQVANINVYDLGQVGANSGVKGVCFWNGTSATPPPEALYIPLGDQRIKDGFEWTLADGADGARTVTMQVVDNAGNSSLTTYTVKLDRTAPSIPESFTHSYANGQLEFCWQASDPDQDLAHFSGEYTLPGKTPISFETEALGSGDTKVGRCSIELKDVAPNQPILIKARSVDAAGNQSVNGTYTAYTPAQLGAVKFLECDYNPVTERHRLKWEITNPGIAETQRLEYGETNGGGFTALGSIVANSAGVFVHNSLPGGAKLAPHATYHYRLVAYNKSNDPTYGPVFDQQVLNQPPAQPVALSLTGFARSGVEFSYTESRDNDGDPLTYKIYLSTSSTPDSFIELSSNSASGLIAGQTYFWYVQARDGYGGRADSATQQFTVDTFAPTLTATEPKRPYSNQTSLTLTAIDDLSGIDRVTYRKINAVSNQVLDEGTVALTSASGGGMTGTMPLTEGSYHLYFTAYDQAGNTRELQLNNLWVDQTTPSLSNVTPSLRISQNRYYTGQLMVPVSFSATDSFSGLSGLRYWLQKSQSESLGSGQWIPISPTLENYALTLEIPGVTGAEYYLALAVEDRAGNRSGITYLGPIVVDLTPPQGSLTLEGLHQSNSGFYCAGLYEITVHPEVTDPESGLSEMKLNLLDTGSGTLIGSWSDWTILKTVPLTPGKTYRVALKGVNQAGLTTQIESETFTYDNTPPQVSVDGPSGRIASGETICLNLAAADPESSITGYRVAIVSDSDSERILPIAGGDSAGWLWINDGGNSTQVRFVTPEGSDGVYYPVVIAQNAAGLTAVKGGATFILDNTQEKILVSDQGPYTMFADHLCGWWRVAGTKPVDDYRYRIVTLAGAIVKDWQVTTESSVTVTDLSLTHGTGYRFEAQAHYTDGSYSEPGFSPGITVDLTPPERTGLWTPEYCTSANLKVQWAGQDLESGIYAYAALGSAFGGSDITGGWVRLNSNTAILSRDVDGNPLPLITGKRYYLTLRLINGAGLITEGTGAAITVDDTAPPTPVVLDQGAYLNTRQPLEANWLWSPEDPESGPATYQWTLLEYGQGLESAVWHDGELSKRIKLGDFTQQHGHTYYFAVRAVNRAGLYSISLSNGIMIDATAPYLPEVKLLNAANLGDPEASEITYITNNQNLGLWIDSLDPESPVDNYLYTWGQPGAVDQNTRLESPGAQIQLNNPQIPEGALTIFAGECGNQAQLVSGTGYSDGVMLDTGAPKITGVSGGVSGNRFYFDWNVEISVAPVAKYEVALVRLEDTAPAVWIDNGLRRTYTYEATNLPDGKYYLLIRAMNQAGTFSRREGFLDEWGVSPVVALDRTPPVISEFTYPRYASSQLKIQLATTDNLSGIGGYQYALGSKSNPVEYSGGWVDLDFQAEKLSCQIPTTGIGQLKEAYLMVRAKDRAGLWSMAQASQAITIDHTPPLRPVVKSGAYTTSKQEISGISFTSTDPDSGISHYRLGVVTEPGGEWLAVQLRPIHEFDGRITGLELTEAGVYYLAVQTQNRAGDWSETGYSGPVTADTIGPQLTFSAAGNPIVIKQPPFGVEYTLSEAARVTFIQTGADGTTQQWTVTGQAGVNRFTFTESAPQIYQIAARPEDLAGNPGTTMIQTIRVNAPPRIVLPAEIGGTPGALIRFTAAVVDPDGTPGQTLRYQWDPGDSSPVLTGSSPEYRYPGQVRDYLLTLTVTDPDGGAATATALVKIRNTAQGTLAMNETWQGVHRIYGKVIVPAGVTLTIAPGTEIIVNGSLDGSGDDGALVIEGNLDAGTGVSFHTNSGLAGSWKGIMAQGTAALTGVTIRDAERGLVIVGTAQAAVADCIFEGNYVGIHVYGARPLIRNCWIRNNVWWGIKEDEAGRPVVIGCRFTGNGIDYYQDEMTRITVDELNGIEGNSGNTP